MPISCSWTCNKNKIKCFTNQNNHNSHPFKQWITHTHTPTPAVTLSSFSIFPTSAMLRFARVATSSNFFTALFVGSENDTTEKTFGCELLFLDMVRGAHRSQDGRVTCCWADLATRGCTCAEEANVVMDVWMRKSIRGGMWSVNEDVCTHVCIFVEMWVRVCVCLCVREN